MVHFFTGSTADEVWLEAAQRFQLREGVRFQPSRAGDTAEIMGAMFEIRDPRQRWVVSRQPAMNPAFAIAEVVWILAGRDDARFLNFWNPALPRYAGTSKTYHGAYGFRLRHKHGVDQLERAYQALMDNPDSRQVVLQIWNPGTDLPVESGIPAAPDIPCNIVSFLKIRDNRLEWTQILRSNDLVLGVPHNFVQFTTLQEIIAGWIGVDMGTYRHYSDCLHIYSHDNASIANLLKQPHIPSKSNIRHSKTESETFFRVMEDRIELMIHSSLSKKRLKEAVLHHCLPRTFAEWLAVLGADCARRRGWYDLASELMGTCRSEVLVHLWEQWYARSSRAKNRMETGEISRAKGVQQWIRFGE